MTAIIRYGRVQVESPQQNGVVCIGETNMAGWDSNQHQNASHGGLFGSNCFSTVRLNYTNDAYEMYDGVINDQDIKISWDLNR